MDYFCLLGLPRRLVIDADLLRTHYYARARDRHPDRNSRDAAFRESTATLSTAELTQAYRTLRDPIARARHWLELEGESLRDQDNRVPTHIANICFATHELLQSRPSMAAGDRLPRLRDQHQQVDRARHHLLGELEKDFLQCDAAIVEPSLQRSRLRDRLLQLTYVDKLLGDIGQAMEGHDGV